MKLLVTGGCGFIGSNFIRYWLKAHPQDKIVNLDKLTYAGHLSSTKDFATNSNYKFIKGDICDADVVEKAMDGVDTVVHFAAESHVDRSVLDPLVFVKTNVLGTAVLLDMALQKKVKRFHHVSTDEVFGQLGEDGKFNEETKYAPRTPYSSSKAGSDHLVRAYFETYGLPVTLTNCSNNFGPYHDPEKLIPRFITNLLQDKKVPLMGKGENIRDWLYVKDHARAIELVLQKGKIGETYCVGGQEQSNLEVTQKILNYLGKDESFIEHVDHRLGHDFRYAIDTAKINKLGWKVEHNFDEWLKKVVDWYVQNKWWWEPLLKEKRPVVDRVAQKHYGHQALH
ncbi:dTDP-glucose 4,6-dehydratase [Candidatus Daviesbacteria bacterium]|nr:dTDP-glucose 4,6-dehydratase [Candidatus Daviesbacteria bacterium]